VPGPLTRLCRPSTPLRPRVGSRPLSRPARGCRVSCVRTPGFVGYDGSHIRHCIALHAPDSLGAPLVGQRCPSLRLLHINQLASLSCAARGPGSVDIKIDGERLLATLTEPQFRETTGANLAAVADGLGISAADMQRAAIIDVGLVWFTIQLACGDAVLALTPDMGKLAALNSISITGVNVFGLYPAGAGADLEVRSFAPGDGIPEDPVCGSGNGCVAALVRRDDILKKGSYHASQGRCVGRDGRVEFDNDTIWLGGHAVTCIEGWLNC